MRLNMIRFKVAANKRHHRKENLPIGSAIKFKRHALKMTLEEASQDICSVSYLSKLENNIIVPNEKYVIQLKERFCLNEDVIGIDDDIYKDLKHKLITALLNDRKMLSNHIKHISMQTNYQTVLLKLGVYVLHEKYQVAHKIFQQIIPMISSMPDEEFSILICLVSRILYIESRYQESSELLESMPINNMPETLLLFRDKWMLLNAMKMENTALFHLLYPVYHEKLIRLGYYKQVNDLKVNKITYFSQNMSVPAYKKLLHENQCLPVKIKLYTKALNLLENQHYKTLLKLIDEQQKTLDSKWYILKLKALDGLKDAQKIKRLMKAYDGINLSHDQKIVVSFLKTKYNSNKESLLLYLRQIILGNNFLTDNVHILKYLQKEAHLLFSKYFYYKEATEVFHKFNQKIDILKKSINYSFEEPRGSFFV